MKSRVIKLFIELIGSHGETSPRGVLGEHMNNFFIALYVLVVVLTLVIFILALKDDL